MSVNVILLEMKWSQAFSRRCNYERLSESEAKSLRVEID